MFKQAYCRDDSTASGEPTSERLHETKLGNKGREGRRAGDCGEGDVDNACGFSFIDDSSRTNIARAILPSSR